MKKIAALMKQTAALLIFGLSLFCLWQGAKSMRNAGESRASSERYAQTAAADQLQVRADEVLAVESPRASRAEALIVDRGAVDMDRIAQQGELMEASLYDHAARGSFERALVYFLISGGLFYWSRKPRAVAALEQHTA